MNRWAIPFAATLLFLAEPASPAGPPRKSVHRAAHAKSGKHAKISSQKRKRRSKGKAKVAVRAPPFVAPLVPTPLVPTPLAPRASGLIIPVQGVRRDQLVDTYAGARSGGREHDAIDIMAPCATPALAAIAGTVLKISRSERGGNTIYQLGGDGATVYYYAHLERYAEGLIEGAPLKQGDVIAYVGDTGNAKPGNCHLHFAIWRVSDVKRYWTGENANPFPLLHD